MTVAELGQRMSARELGEWIALSRLEPFGDARADLRAGIVASAVVNVHRSRDDEPLTPDDFMPDFYRQPEPEDDGVADIDVQILDVMGKLTGEK